MVQSVINLNETLKYNKIIQIKNMPLWYNSKLDLEFRKEWE